MSRRPARWRNAVVATQVVALGALAACSGGVLGSEDPTPASGSASGGPVEVDPDDSSTEPGTESGTEPSTEPGTEPGDPSSYAVPQPGKRKSQLTSDVLITSSDTLPDAVVERIRAIKGVRAALPIGLSSSSVNGRTLTIASGDPGQIRRFAQPESYVADFVWDRVAGGEVAVDPTVKKKVIDKGDMIQLSTREDIDPVHVGAFAPLIAKGGPAGDPAIQVVVNPLRGEQLGIPSNNALLVSTGSNVPSALTKQFKAAIGKEKATLDMLALEFNIGKKTAVLSGGSVSDAIGTFTYTNGPNGTINPNQGWVDSFIRREEVPILGMVTCNKGMLPQLRGALSDVVRAGLADQIHAGEYAGCYYPRYIGRSSANGLSLHSWGIAVDLNVPGNQRGTVGEMNREVVAIFKNWGFAWGGDWNYTDPMHFEMNRVVRAR